MKLFILLFVISFNVYCETKEVIPSFFKCKKTESCINKLVGKEKIWGRLNSNYDKTKRLWKKNPTVRFQILGKEGEQKIEKIGNEFIPLIVLPQISDPYELVISLNHELVHSVNSHSSLKYIGDNEKINNCLTRYRLEQLKDEGAAFREEIHFWEQSPKWFRKHFANQFFESKLLEKKLSYEEYYKILKQKMGAEVHFIEKRYIALGEYPICAKDLL